MKVESFECDETRSEPIEASQEAMSLIEELGLEGQKSLCNGSKDSLDAGRIPYRQMYAEELFVYRVLCPNRFALQDYDRSPIPLRVLQIASHAKSLDFFDRIVVWDRASALEKDPVLVGETKDAKYSWMTNNWILARWGEELETFSVLLGRAAVARREQLKTDLAKAKASIMAAEAALRESTDAQIVEWGHDASIKLIAPY